MDEDALAALESERAKRRAHRRARAAARVLYLRSHPGIVGAFACQLAVTLVAVGLILTASSSPRPPNDRALAATLSSAHLAPISDRGACPHIRPIHGVTIPVHCYRVLAYKAGSEDAAKQQLLAAIQTALSNAGWQVGCQLSTAGKAALGMRLPDTSDQVLIEYGAPSALIVIFISEPGATCTENLDHQDG